MNRPAYRARVREQQTEAAAEPLAGQDPRIRADPAWQDLRPGDRVTAYPPGGAATAGVVDTMTGERDIIWVRFDGAIGRRMIHGDENITITVHPAGETGTPDRGSRTGPGPRTSERTRDREGRRTE